MVELSFITMEEPRDTYNLRSGKKIRRKGKAFSYTFWRTEIEGEVFWSVQGFDPESAKTWIVTKYFGPPEQARFFLQEVTLRHPTERKIKITYRGTCRDGENQVEVSRCIVNQFKKEDNTFAFDFRIVKRRRSPYPVRMV